MVSVKTGGEQMHHIESDAICGIEMQLLPERVGYTVAELLKFMHKLVTNMPIIPLPVFKNKSFTDVWKASLKLFFFLSYIF